MTVCRSLDYFLREFFVMSSTAVILTLVVVLVIIVFWVFSIYNGLVAMRQRVDQAFADIDVQLKQRQDLVPNLVETVKGYAAHERGTLEEVIKARTAAMSAQGPAQAAAAEGQLTTALKSIFALSESYPDLKANANFQQLQRDLSDIENKLAAARRFFNNAVQEYNTGIALIPAVWFAASFGFTRKEFFDLGEQRAQLAEAPPSVKF
ncbi:MAG: LemA family protein [Desulfobulbus sp.]|nr:LemA family protein [Desulfobulbus sp.]